MILTYEAISDKGVRTKDSVEAPDARQAIEQLRRQGLYITKIEEQTQRKTLGNRKPGAPQSLRLPLRGLAIFTRQVAMLLRAGSGLVPALTGLKKQMKKPAQAELLQKLVDDLEEGSTLTEALQKHPRTFDSVYCAVIAAGEASGNLTEMFERLAVMVGKRRVLRNKVIGALAYPSLLICMSVNILATMLFFVIPRFTDMFDQLGVDPPGSTKMLMATSSLFINHWPLLCASCVAIVLGIIWVLASDRGRQWLADMQLVVPGLGRLRGALIQAQIFRTVGMLLESGVSILESIALIRNSTRNRRFQRLFRDVEETVTRGGDLAPTFEKSGLIQPYICQAIQTGEQSGSMGGALTYSADLLDETNTELIDTTMKLIEPIILIGLGFMVGGVAISLFLPLFDLTAAIQ